MDVDAIMDIGNLLQEARIAKNISLDTAAQETNIRKVYLEAVEQNDFARLQGDVYVKGVMRTYGNYLGLDGAQLVEEFKAASAGTGPVKNNNTIRESHHVKVRPTFKSNRDIGSGNGDKHRLLFFVIGIFAAVLVAAGGFYYYMTHTGWTANIPLPFLSETSDKAKEQNTNSAKSESKNKEQGKIEQKETVTVASENNTVSDNKTAETVTKDISVNNTPAVNGRTELKITSTGKCWLRVTDQKGTVLFEGNLLKGESKIFTSNSSIVMRIGNLKDLQIEHNGKILPFEATDEAVTRTYLPAKK